MKNNFIPAFWFSSNNFGDALNPWLIKLISGGEAVLIEASDPVLKYVCVGSIIGHPVRSAAIWGAGVGFRDQPLHELAFVYAVRGKITGELLDKKGISHMNVYGDPAMLLKSLFPIKRSKRYRIGIVPHYAEQWDLYNTFQNIDISSEGIKIINPLNDVGTFLHDINQCEVIFSSSLHGIIAADAYNIPSARLILTNDKILGDGVKYEDYYTNLSEPRPELNIQHANDKLAMKAIKEFVKLRNMQEPATVTCDLDALYQSCPFKR